MCRGSVNAQKTEDAVSGVVYDISRASHGDFYHHGVLHRPENGPIGEGKVACAACIQGSATVMLANIPEEVQRSFGIGARVSALFLSGDGEEHGKDKIELPDGRQIPLWDFGCQGITLELVPVDVRKPESEGIPVVGGEVERPLTVLEPA